MIDKIVNKIIFFFPIILITIFLNFYYDGEIYKASNIWTVLLIFFFSFFLIKKSIFITQKESLIVYLFIFICLISCFLGENIFLSLKRFIIVFLPFFIIFQFFQNHRNIELIKHKIELNLLFFVLFLCVYSIVIFLFDINAFQKILSHEVSKTNFFNLGQIYYTREDLFSYNLYRPSSLLSNTIGFSQLILISIFICLNININSILKSFILILLSVCLIWTFSRINLLIFLSIPIILLALRNKNFFIFLLMIKAIVFFSLIIIQIPSIQNIVNINLNEINLGNLDDRFKIYEFSLSHISTYLFSGVGFGLSSENFIMKILDGSTKLYSDVNKNNDIYNLLYTKNLAIASVPITVLVETGIFGLLIYITLLPILIKKNRNFHLKNVKNTYLILTIILFTQYLDISLFRFHPLTFIFAMYLGITCNKNLKFNA